MLDGVVITVVGGLILEAFIGGVALVRQRVSERSDVRILAKVTDDPVPGFITWRNGLVLDVEVHVLRSQPMRITEVGLELRDGTRHSLDTSMNLDKPIAAPDFVEASDYLQGVRKTVAAAGSPVRGFYAIATPARTFQTDPAT